MSLLNPFANQIRAFSDKDLLAAHERTSGELGNPQTDVLLAEIERCELDL